ncbi:MAG: hypothetical protein AAF564_12700, partial [Bacteroidota bacterium]
ISYSVVIYIGCIEESFIKWLARLITDLDIGGDEQRILYKDTSYSNITFKHILLPIWISSYRYKGEIYRFMVNGQTGEVQGQRPWSKLKIAAAIFGGLLLVAILIFVLEQTG